ncbi:MAG: ABC transporter ATP-binding protein [Cyanobacteria bacterium REEB65]|nr:ABC transporter ATP-binding protein [Cyanobacteria bacterium REEB65]
MPIVPEPVLQPQDKALAASLAAGKPAVCIESLVKDYGSLRAVDGISFSVPQGDFFGFLGPNGAGKTTTIHCLVGLATPSDGAIRVFGHDVVRDYRAARQLIGLSPQEYNFDRYLTNRETLIYSAGYFGIPERESRKRADELLQRFGLWSKREETFVRLSGGMKRRLTIARALIHQPRVLILDEPTAGVDVELRLELWEFLRELNHEGLTIILTTHYLEEAEELCKRIAIIDQGKIIAMEDKASLVAKMAGHRLRVVFAQPLDRPVSLPGLDIHQSGSEVVVRGAEPQQISAILAELARFGQILDVAVDRKSLQDIFLELTGRGPSRVEDSRHV